MTTDDIKTNINEFVYFSTNSIFPIHKRLLTLGKTKRIKMGCRKCLRSPKENKFIFALPLKTTWITLYITSLGLETVKSICGLIMKVIGVNGTK